MNKIFVEDFYDWHPTIEMASKTLYDKGTSQHIIVRLYSEIDYEKEELRYTVSESVKGGIFYWNFNILDDAVDCYNKRLIIYEVDT